MKQWIDRLRRERTLRPEEFRQLLTGCDAEILRYINKQAQEVALLHFGNKIYIRGLIEISNCCRNNCYYCGIRKGNPNIERYRLSRESILNCCKQGYELGFRTFVLQGGEDNNELDIDILSEKIKEANEIIAFCKDKLTKADREVEKLLQEKRQSEE